MTDEQLEELADLLRAWLQAPPRSLPYYTTRSMGPYDLITRMKLESLRSEAVQGATALLKQLLVELGGQVR